MDTEQDIAPDMSEESEGVIEADGVEQGAEASGADTDGEADGAAPLPRTRRTVPSLDFFKPQFIDFENPLLVELFARAPQHLSDFEVIIEERLPDHGDLPEGPDGRHAIELIMQVDFPDRASTDDSRDVAP